MQLSLANRTFLVTGGSSGIGAGVAETIVAACGDVMIAGRNADRLAAAAEKLTTSSGQGSGTVHYIRPGLTRTDLVAPVMQSPQVTDDYRRCTPLPRFGEVDDIANLALFLLSDAAGWITGQIINVDGGHGLRRGPDMSGMLEPVFGADGLRRVV